MELRIIPALRLIVNFSPNSPNRRKSQKASHVRILCRLEKEVRNGSEPRLTTKAFQTSNAEARFEFEASVLAFSMEEAMRASAEIVEDRCCCLR